MSLLFKAPRTSQPQGAATLDAANRLAKNLTLAMPLAGSLLNVVNGKSGVNNGSFGFAPVPAGMSVRLNGSSQYLSIPVADFACPITEWAYAVTVTTVTHVGVNPMISSWDNGVSGRNLYLYITSGVLYFDVPYKQAVVSATAPSAGTHRYVVTRNASTISVYVDGKLWMSGTISTTQEAPTQPLLFGKNSGGENYLNGYVAGIAAWPRGLSAAEAKADADNPWQIYTSPSRSLWIPGTVSGGTTSATITQADGADSTALTTTVTTGASLAASDTADTQAITAANWTTAQLAQVDRADTHSITATAGSITSASVAQADSGDATAITMANWTTALLAYGTAADTTSITTAVTTGAAIAVTDAAHTTAVTGDIVGVTSASVAAVDAADTQAIATLVTTGAVIVGTDGADTAVASAACWTTAIVAAVDGADTQAIACTVAGTLYWPLPADVRLGVAYGPTGADYVGTLTGGTGPSAADIAAAVWSYTQ